MNQSYRSFENTLISESKNNPNPYRYTKKEAALGGYIYGTENLIAKKYAGTPILISQAYTYEKKRVDGKYDQQLAHRFQLVKDHDTFLKLIANTSPKYRTYNECIREHQKTKIIFDLEWMNTVEGFESEIQFSKKDTLAAFYECVMETCMIVFGKQPSQLNFVKMKSSREVEYNTKTYYKHSYHIILSKFGYLPDLQNYVKEFVDVLKETATTKPEYASLLNRLVVSGSGVEQSLPVFDMGIYKKDKLIREI